MKMYVNKKAVNLDYNAFFTPPFTELTKCAYKKILSDDDVFVEIEYDYEITSACIRPQKSGITPTVIDNKVSFWLKEHCNISVEINDSIEDAVILFFDIPKKESFPDNMNILRFTGKQYIDILDITTDNTVLYFEEDCVVHGKIRAKGVDNLKILGYGTITMKNYIRDNIDINTRCIDILECKNVEIKNILITDSTQWSFRCDNCDNVIIDNVKVFGHRSNNDGFDICGSRNVIMRNCFVRSFDDSVSVKGLNTGNIENILVEKCVFWNDMARSMNIGSEISADFAKNIVFRDIDVIHNLTSYPICQIHNGDRSEVSDVVFENIRIENAPNSYLFDLRIKSCYWNTDTKNGSIDNVLFKDIQILGTEGKDFTNLTARIEGLKDCVKISNVKVENLTVFGKSVSSPEECGLSIYGKCDNIDFIIGKNNFNLLKPEITFEEDMKFINGRYESVLKVKFVNENKHSVTGKFGIKISPKNSAKYSDTLTEYSLAPGEAFEKFYNISAQAGKYVIQIISDKIGMKNTWKYFEISGQLTDKPQKFEFNDYYKNVFDDIFLSVKNKFLIIESEYLLNHNCTVYTAVPSELCDEEVLFTCEECDFGEAYPIKYYNGKPDIAYELGNPQEITLVYLNMPKTKINKCKIEPKLAINETSRKILIPFSKLGLNNNTKEILLEIAFDDNLKKRYNKTLFRSVDPDNTSHMFAKFRLNNN